MTRKQHTMYEALYPRDHIDRQYVSGKERKRGHANIQDSKDRSIRGLDDNIKKTKKT